MCNITYHYLAHFLFVAPSLVKGLNQKVCQIVTFFIKWKSPKPYHQIIIWRRICARLRGLAPFPSIFPFPQWPFQRPRRTLRGCLSRNNTLLVTNTNRRHIRLQNTTQQKWWIWIDALSIDSTQENRYAPHRRVWDDSHVPLRQIVQSIRFARPACRSVSKVSPSLKPHPILTLSIPTLLTILRTWGWS